jgi:hypothetical protein
MSNFFTASEINTIHEAIKELSLVGLVIKDRDTKHDLSNNKELTEREAFFGKAKLWKVVQGIIEKMYLNDIISGKLEFYKEHHKITVKERDLRL